MFFPSCLLALFFGYQLAFLHNFFVIRGCESLVFGDQIILFRIFGFCFLSVCLFFVIKPKNPYFASYLGLEVKLLFGGSSFLSFRSLLYLIGVRHPLSPVIRLGLRNPRKKRKKIFWVSAHQLLLLFFSTSAPVIIIENR